jgi:hypothetical protein
LIFSNSAISCAVSSSSSSSLKPGQFQSA